MSSATGDSIVFSNIAATTAPFTLVKGGRFGVTVSATGSGSVILNKRAADGLTYVPCQNINGSAAGFITTGGYQVFDLPTGTYEFAIATFTAVYIEALRIRGE